MSEKKGSLFSFTKMNKYYLIPFITPLICFAIRCLMDLIIEENNQMNLLYFPIINSIADIIAGLIYFIQLYQNQSKDSNSKRDIKKDKNKCKITCIIIFMSFLVCPFYICFILYKELLLFLPFSLDIILSIFFSIFLLKINIYKHQILSIIISFIGFIFLLFSNIQITFEKFYMLIIISLLNCTYISVLKYSTTIYFISPFLCSFLYGLISFIIYNIGSIIYTLYKFKDFSFMQDIYAFHGKMFTIYFSLLIIVFPILKALTLLEIYYFSPILYFISETISPMLYSFYIKILSKNGQSNYIYIFIIIGFLFEIISIFLYNEIIIINACGLNENTVKYIKEREKEEKIGTLYDNDNDNENIDKNNDNYFEIENYKTYLD